MGLHIFRPAFFRRLHLRLNRRLRRRICGPIRELTAQLCHDGLSEFGLHGKHVLQITSKVFRPELLARVGAGEPGRDPHAVAGLAHASLDQMRHAKFLPDLLGRRILAFERKCRCPCRHVQPRNFLQHSQQFLTDAVGKIFAALVIAEVNERQHGDRLLIRCSWRRYGQRIGPHGRCRLAVLTRAVHEPPCKKQTNKHDGCGGYEK